MTLSKKQFSIYTSVKKTNYLIKKEQNRLVIIKKSITFALAFEKETTIIVSLSQANEVRSASSVGRAQHF